jgi:hypothetical protein
MEPLERTEELVGVRLVEPDPVVADHEHDLPGARLHRERQSRPR